jgi:hypothetical protein
MQNKSGVRQTNKTKEPHNPKKGKRESGPMDSICYNKTRKDTKQRTDTSYFDVEVLIII